MPERPRVELSFEGCDPDQAPGYMVTRAAQITLDRKRPEGREIVTVLVTDDSALRRLNREFTGDDEVTDVLAFPAAGEAAEFPTPEEATDHLGDIAISLPQATRQAVNAGHSVDREIAMLTAHGVLHLLGYDHADPAEREVMFGETEAIVIEALAGP